MRRTALQWLRRALVAVVSTALSSGCADDAPLGPEREAPLPYAASGNDHRTADLGACANLQVPEGNKLALRLYAEGVQIYHWTGTGWTFDGPSAALFADASGKSTFGIHYAGPTWESVSGSKVVGTVLERCTPDAGAIPWLLLGAVSAEGPGVFHRITFIQRVNTVGGNAPSDPGSLTGEEVRVPYTTEYLFYRAH